MKHLLTFSLILSFIGCSSKHINKEKYEIQIGETIEIFYGQNSCCERCWNDIELKHLNFVETKTIDFDEDCSGCTSTYSKIYKAVSVGIDTIKTQSYAVSDSCNLDSGSTDIFLVTIKNK